VLPDELGRPPAEIDYVVAYLTSAVLHDYELIDTPGLEGLGGMDFASSATRRALGGDDTSAEMGSADLKVFLSDCARRGDEMQFVTDIGASRIDTLALLSHADRFGEGAFGPHDPIELADRDARRLQEELMPVAGTVVAVSGLLAQTAFTGHLTEDDARALQRIADVADSQIEPLLAGEISHASAMDIDRLLALVGEYGVVHLDAKKISSPRSSASMMTVWMAAGMPATGSARQLPGVMSSTQLATSTSVTSTSRSRVHAYSCRQVWASDR
jgi:hypothetical protein